MISYQKKNKNRNTSKVSLLYSFYSKIGKNVRSFADLSILLLIQSLNGCLRRDTDSLVKKLIRKKEVNPNSN